MSTRPVKPQPGSEAVCPTGRRPRWAGSPARLSGLLTRGLVPLVALGFSQALAEKAPIDLEFRPAEPSLVFPARQRINYMIQASGSLKDWHHLATVRGDGPLSWNLPPQQTSSPAAFFRVVPVEARGVGNLTAWAAFAASTSGSFRIGLVGDSYTHTPSRYVLRLRDHLVGVHGDLGPGFCGFGFQPSFRRNGSIAPALLDFWLYPDHWTSTYGDGYGPDACHVEAAVPLASISVGVGIAADVLRLFYLPVPGTTGLIYHVGDNAWRYQPTDGSPALATLDIDVSGVPAPFEVEIMALSAGVSLLGAEAVVAGDGVVVHKLAASGRRADNFMTNQIARDATCALDLDMVVILFGINEQAGNRTPESFGGAIRNLVESLRNVNPSLDLVLMLPPYTKFEAEVPGIYSLDDYGMEMEQVADSFGGAYLKLTEVFGPAAELQNLIDANLISTDRIHPTTGSRGGGHLIADTLAETVFSLYD